MYKLYRGIITWNICILNNPNRVKELELDLEKCTDRYPHLQDHSVIENYLKN